MTTGEIAQVTSTDVNDYLREATGADITAKDFRTWGGTVLAAAELAHLAGSDDKLTAKANVKEAIDTVAGSLGNTPTICRKCYVHPRLIEDYLEGEFKLPRSDEAGPVEARSRRAGVSRPKDIAQALDEGAVAYRALLPAERLHRLTRANHHGRIFLEARMVRGIDDVGCRLRWRAPAGRACGRLAGGALPAPRPATTAASAKPNRTQRGLLFFLWVRSHASRPPSRTP